MNCKRLCRHLTTSHFQVQRAFPADSLQAIEAAIKASELAHAGEIRFVVEAALDIVPLWHGQTARERAIEVFSQLRVWDTEYNNGVLVYLLLAERDVEIIADRGIGAKVPQEEWQAICREMEAALGQSKFAAGVISGIQAIGRHLISTFPARDAGRNELSNRPLVI
jgi:uncharacterized membrane protein